MVTLTVLALVAGLIAYVGYLCSRIGKPPYLDLQTVLINDEGVRSIASQIRLYALLHRRVVAASTSGRLIVLTRRLLGGYSMFDLRWQDIKSARITVGMLSSSLHVQYSSNLSDTAMDEGDSRTVTVSGLTTPEAQALYRDCQSEDQAWREKRRVRSIEEMRAKAGGVQVATGLYPGGSTLPPVRPLELTRSDSSEPAEALRDKLIKAQELRSQGLITDSEYETIKARIISAF
jgi:hypothetical protein